MSKEEIQKIVTDKIIAAMEKGIVPWRTPWTSAGPTSLSTGKGYRGINTLILETVAACEGYEKPLWGTFKQIQGLGGQVRKGEKATPVVLWKPMEKEDEEGNRSSFMLMRYFSVFNVAQADGLEIPEKFLQEREPVAVLDGVEAALNYPGGPEVGYAAQDRAFYSPAEDRITLPMLDQFTSPEAFAGTALHEAVHSTGHPSRCARFEIGGFSCKDYASEELVAEVGAAMLAHSLGIRVEWDQHAAYLASWLKVLKDDRGLIVSAAQKAQKAVDLITAQSDAATLAA